MDYYGSHDSAIDRAFAPTSHGQDNMGAMHDLSNASAPVPRKRPTAKPAHAAPTHSGSESSAVTSPTSSTLNHNANNANNNSKPGSPPAQNQNQNQQNGSSSNGNNAHSLSSDQADNMAQIQQLRQQMAEGTSDPAQQAQMMARMTGLMNELQAMMAQMAMISSGHHSSGAGTPTAPNDGGFGRHSDLEAQTGLRSSAKPFEPTPLGGGSGAPNATNNNGGGGYFGGRGAGSTFGNHTGNYSRGGYGAPSAPGGHGAQRYQPVSSLANPYSALNNNGGSGGWNQTGFGGSNNNNDAPNRNRGCVICFVEFKRGRMKRYESDMFIAPGNYIIVEGDRGEDCGLVVHTFQRLPDGSTGRSETLEGVVVDSNKVKPETGRVRRIATEQEVERLHGEIATLERHALKTCRERVEAMQLEMDVVDCEYQFDRKKITFFFDSPRAIDFRELTKDLFKHFGARIWLENINSKVKNVVPDGALSHADKLLYAERGLRPPRR